MSEEYAKKRCPRCGETLYADMQVCYGCLYDFTRSDNGPSELACELDEPDGMREHDRSEADAAPAPRLSDDLGGMPAPTLVAERDGGGKDAGAGRRGEAPRELEPEDPRARAAGPRACGAGARPRPEPARPLPARAAGLGASEDVEVTTVLGGGAATGLGRVRVSGAGLDVLVPMGAGGLAVGRGSANQVVIHDKAVSRRHLRLMPAPGGARALDLGATNPAIFCGAPIRGEVFVAWGESVQVGEVSLSPGE